MQESLDFYMKSVFSELNYQEKELDQETIDKVEKSFNIKLPLDYIEFIKKQNGGVVSPYFDAHKCKEKTPWALNHIAITGFLGLGEDRPYSIFGRKGQKQIFVKEKFPKIGLPICTCPDDEPSYIFLAPLDENGKENPDSTDLKVFYVSKELKFRPIFLANSFTEFVENLHAGEEYDDDDFCE